MAKFIKFTANQDEVVFLNLDLVSTAKYRPADGTLSLVVHGTKDRTGGVEYYTLRGQEAVEALNVLHAAK